MKTTRVTIAGGITPTEVPCSIPCKFAVISEDNPNPEESLFVTLKQPNHTYADEVKYAPGEKVIIQGYSGIIARPAGYSAYQIPATSEALCKIRTVSGTGITVKVQEYETPPSNIT